LSTIVPDSSPMPDMNSGTAPTSGVPVHHGQLFQQFPPYMTNAPSPFPSAMAQPFFTPQGHYSIPGYPNLLQPPFLTPPHFKSGDFHPSTSIADHSPSMPIQNAPSFSLPHSAHSDVAHRDSAFTATPGAFITTLWSQGE
jgi:hypothetical protein